MRYLVAYDVCDNKRRGRLFKLLLGYGFNVEFSVFEIDIPEKDIKKLEKDIRNIINPKEDSVYIFPYTIKPIRNGIFKNKEYGDIFV